MVGFGWQVDHRLKFLPDFCHRGGKKCKKMANFG
jgi:hypothetical protein